MSERDLKHHLKIGNERLISRAVPFSSIGRAAAIISVTLLLPLAGNPILMTHPKIILLAIAGFVMLLSQHDLKKVDAKDQMDTDRGSVVAILISAIVSQVIPVAEWGYYRSEHWGNPIVNAIGLCLMSSGLALRIWSIRAMGEFFSVTVQILPGHRVIKHGPFAIVRHPCYLGAILTLVGCAVFLNAFIGAAVAAITTCLAYGIRLRMEERMLLDTFGSEYRQYMQATPMLVPYPWSVGRRGNSK